MGTGAVIDPTPEIAASNPVLIALAQRIAAGECILFLGAGVHAPSPDGGAYAYRADQAPPRGGDLSELLARGTNYATRYPRQDPRNLSRVAGDYEQQLGRQQLVADIKTAVTTGKAPSPALRALAELDFPLVITTNYDQLFEQALTRPFDRCVYSPDDTQATRDVSGGLPTPKRPFILKIHGDVDSPESIVVTDDDYIQFVLRMGDKEAFNPVPLGVRFALKTWPTLFIGYSLTDYNLRLLFKTLRWRMDRASFPISYAVDPSPDELVVFSFTRGGNRQVIFLEHGVWGFVPVLYRLIKGQEMPK